MNNQSKVCIAGKNEIAVFGLHFLVKQLGKENTSVCLNSNDERSLSWQPSLRQNGSHLDGRVDISDINALDYAKKIMMMKLLTLSRSSSDR